MEYKYYWMLRSKSYYYAGGDVIVVPKTTEGEKQLATLRKKYPQFAGKRKKLKHLIIPDDFKYLGVMMDYDKWNNLLWECKNKEAAAAKKEAEKQAKKEAEEQAKKEAELLKRSDAPRSGDYLRLYQHGRLSEDFTFVHELIAEHGDERYVVLDINHREYHIEAEHDRDNGTRRAFKQIITGELHAKLS